MAELSRRLESGFLLPDRRLPIRKKKTPSASPVSLTSAASGWLRNRRKEHGPFPRECKRYVAPRCNRVRVCDNKVYGFVGPGMSNDMQEFPELQDFEVICGLLPPVPMPMT